MALCLKVQLSADLPSVPPSVLLGDLSLSSSVTIPEPLCNSSSTSRYSSTDSPHLFDYTTGPYLHLHTPTLTSHMSEFFYNAILGTQLQNKLLIAKSTYENNLVTTSSKTNTQDFYCITKGTTIPSTVCLDSPLLLIVRKHLCSMNSVFTQSSFTIQPLDELYPRLLLVTPQ